MLSRWGMLVRGRVCAASSSHSTRWLCLSPSSVASADRPHSDERSTALRHTAPYRAWPLISPQRASRKLACASGAAEEPDPGKGLSKFGVDVPLRDYQEKTIEDILSNLEAGLTRQLVSLPTGSGKTVVFLTLARILNKKTLVIANSVELIAQTEQRLSEVWPGVWSGVVQGKRNVYDRKVVIATVQTASNPKRLEALSEQDFELLIIDEAHHSTANTYMSIMLNLGFLNEADAASVTGKAWARTQLNDDQPAANTLWRQQSPAAASAAEESSTDRELQAPSTTALQRQHSPPPASEAGESTNHAHQAPSTTAQQRQHSPPAASEAEESTFQDLAPSTTAQQHQPPPPAASEAGESTSHEVQAPSTTAQQHQPPPSAASEARESTNHELHATSTTAQQQQHSPPAVSVNGDSTLQDLAPSTTSTDNELKSPTSSSNSNLHSSSPEAPHTSISMESNDSSTSVSDEGIGSRLGSSQGTGGRDGKTKIIIGCTATPYRHGKDKLDQVFDSLVQAATLGDLIRGGYLCKVYAERILTYQDISSAVDEEGHLTNSEKELGKAVDTPERNKLVVSAYKAKALNKDGSYRKAVAFCCSLEHAENLAKEFMENGIAADMVSSRSTKDERAQLLKDHREGRIQVLTNCGVLTEGYDDTSISCILMTRPTSSSGLYTQCVGRGLRTHPGKEDCVLLDFTDRLHALDKESDLVTSKDLFKGEEGVITLKNYDPELRNELGRELSMILGGKFQLYSQQKYLWVQRFNDLYMSVPTGSAQEKRRRFLMKDQQPQAPPQGNIWVLLQQLPSSRPTGRGSKPRSNFCLRVSAPSFNPPLDSPGQWTVLHEFIDTPPGSFEAKVLAPAEKILGSSEQVPNLNSMKLATYRQRSSWPNELVSEKQLRYIESRKWLPEGTDTSRMTKGQAASIITLGKVDDAVRRASQSTDSSRSVAATAKQQGYLNNLLERHSGNPDVQAALEQEGLQTALESAGVKGLSKQQASVAINCIKLHAARE